jgi:hypothetical protein
MEYPAWKNHPFLTRYSKYSTLSKKRKESRSHSRENMIYFLIVCPEGGEP